MRIVYIGVVDFSFYCLETLLANNAQVVGVVTSKDNSYNSDFRDLTPVAERYEIPVHYSRNINSKATLEWIQEKRPDVIFCWGISQLIKPELLSLPPMGIVGVHPSLLPQNRGRHPLIWALALGLKTSGLTFFFMDEGTDTGPILSQREFDIESTDDASTLYQKIKDSAYVQIPEFLPQLTSGDYQITPQSEEKANYWRKRSRKDGVIDWRMGTESVLGLVRALTRPYPGAEFMHLSEPFRVWKAERYPGPVADNLEPGRVLGLLGNSPIVKCADGAVVIAEYEPESEFPLGICLE